MIEPRYAKALGLIEETDMKILKKSNVCVLGIGGGGCQVLEMLARLGVGELTLVDGDLFDESNLNRQIFATMSTIGRSKVRVAKERIAEINPDTTVNAIEEHLTIGNAKGILEKHDVIVDTMNDIDMKIPLQVIAEQLNVPVMFAGIFRWEARVGVMMPKDATYTVLYDKAAIDRIKNVDTSRLGVSSFMCGIVAGIIVGEVIKYLLHGTSDLMDPRLSDIDIGKQTYPFSECFFAK